MDTLPIDVPPNPKPEEGTFQLGLVMAGAVSAGAYTAGVLDFLIEALDEWEAARARGEAVPSHRVKLRALAGASAGGMCAAILAALLQRRFPPARAGTECHANPLWRAWVEGPRIEALLDTADRGAAAGPVLSLLNVGVLQRIVDAVLDAPGDSLRRPWVADALPLSLALGNLRGVPFGMAFGGEGTPAHKMRLHADSAGFVLGDAARYPGFTPLGTPPGSASGNWPQLGQAALASGAFPLFLRARGLARPGSDYAKRQLLVPGDRHPDSDFRKDEIGTLLPDWPGAQVPDPYRYLTVDGGVFDNEPLELCRRHMMDVPGQRLVRDGRYADRSVLMIDPFPDALAAGPEDAATPLAGIAAALVDAWKMQCRFGVVDVALAGASDVYSRMMIVPSRGRTDEASGAPLAAGGLGAFLGFFHEAFRAHDFMLGRRNCQRFLRLHLALPTSNALFGAVPFIPADATHEEDLRARWPKQPHWPVIPLLGTAALPQELPEWPRGRFDPAALAPLLQARMDAVVADLLRPAPLGRFGSLAARGYWMWKKDAVLKAILARIKAELVAKQLA